MGQNSKDKGKISWQSPSNIALIKYWGKHGNQLPCNPSLSMTLNSSVTDTSLTYSKKEDNNLLSLEFYFEGHGSQKFEERATNYLNSILSKHQFLGKFHLKIESRNTFPHSSGIASSASAFSALALCIMSLKEVLIGEIKREVFLREASELARLGSGSASRSIYGGYTIWGEINGITAYSDLFANPVKSFIHPIFQSYSDAILVVSAKKKKVGSSEGHALMNDNPFAKVRYQQAKSHTVEMIQVLQNGDTDRFIEIVEKEAMTLHGLMMLSEPGFILMKQETIEIIDKIREFRRDQHIPITFTLDAGPNVHVLYPEEFRKEVVHFIEKELLVFCEGNQWIDDKIGEGPELLND